LAGNVSANSYLSFILDTTAPDVLTAALALDTNDDSDHITSSATINISGLESDATWEYNLNGGSEWVAGSGSSIIIQDDGSYTLQVRQMDLAGNVSNAGSLSFTLDTTAPADIGYVYFNNRGTESYQITNDGTVYANGLEADALLQYSLDGGSSWESVTTTNSFCGTTALAYGNFALKDDGQKNVVIRQLDKAGNTSNETSLSFILDTSAGAPSLTLASDTGTSSTDFVTSNGLINVDGLESNATWEFSLNGGSTWAAGEGDTFTVTEADSYDIRVRQTDMAGNISDDASLSFILDTTVATPTLILVNDTGKSSSDRITNDGRISVDGLESGATWEYSTNKGNTWNKGEGNSFELISIKNEMRVRQTDLAGNKSSEGSLTVTYDTTAPASLNSVTVKDTGLSASDKITNDGTITAGFLESGATLEYSLDSGSTWAQGQVTSTNASTGKVILTGDGEKNVLIRQVDAAGNASATRSVSFTLDTTAPTTPEMTFTDTGSSSSDLITNDGLINVNGLESTGKWEYSLNSGSTWTTGSGSSFEVTTDASYDIRVRQTDLAGNVSNAGSLSVTLDKTIPTSVLLELESGVALTSSTFITNDRTILINNLESGATWEYRGTGASNWTIGSGSSLEISGDDGEKYVQIRQTDAAGNVQSMWDDITFTLDTTAPEGPSPYLASDSNISTDRITNNRLVNIDYLESGATWEYSLDGSTWTDGSGSSVAVEGSGEKTIRVRQTDQAGNDSDIESLSFTLDTSATAPTVSLINDSGTSNSDRITNDGRVSVDGLESDASWQFSVDGGSSWTSGSGSSFTVT
ncbi:MAG: Ig-like domain-containing protein, partial [Pseudohongiella sp.]|nr:Ig-like domain-containing protein [Pseudohongiella sp.]